MYWKIAVPYISIFEFGNVGLAHGIGRRWWVNLKKVVLDFNYTVLNQF